MLSRKERQERLQHFGLPPHSLKMKRTVSLPNAISNSTTPLPSSSNCGYDSPMGTSTTTSMTPSCRPPRPTFLSLAHSTSNSSRLTSLVSPANERLSGIDEESKETYPVRSSTVPDALSKNAKDLSNEQMDLRNGNLLLSSSSSKISPLGDCASSASGCAGSGALGAMRWANKPPQGLDLNV
ncbi:hypothetical protein WR25_02192 [Diploscapter pachys]|uniref:Uncharacterized protein n=1 Tax=Diploscapter pachys TaxID=2018661 RepID=A0A2A2J9G3_9BILA|nr:hypothetical protein WR25_02192 [Diploscapter pachys]